MEDEPDIQAVAELALEMVGGYQVTICNSGQEALNKVSGFAPDLILLDLMMPGMDGPTTLRNLHADPVNATIPVIFLTAKVHVRSDAVSSLGRPKRNCQTLRPDDAGSTGSANMGL